MTTTPVGLMAVEIALAPVPRSKAVPVDVRLDLRAAAMLDMAGGFVDPAEGGEYARHAASTLRALRVELADLPPAESR